MDRAEAIKRFEKQLSSALVVLDSGFGTRPHESNRLYVERKEMAEIALAALREQEQREQGCEVCKGITIISGAFNGTGPADENHLLGVDYDGDFEFCPMCGRKLGGVEE